MITSIKIYNRWTMDMWARKPGQINAWKKSDKQWNLISVHSNKELLTKQTIKAFKAEGMQFSLSLSFDDVTMPEHGHIFTKRHAEKIVNFINFIKNDKHEEELIVHCEAGISRSGAIGTFACDHLNLNYKDFIKDNPLIFSNHFILNTLHELVGTKMRYDGRPKTEFDLALADGILVEDLKKAVNRR